MFWNVGNRAFIRKSAVYHTLSAIGPESECNREFSYVCVTSVHDWERGPAEQRENEGCIAGQNLFICLHNTFTITRLAAFTAVATPKGIGRTRK